MILSFLDQNINIIPNIITIIIGKRASLVNTTVFINTLAAALECTGTLLETVVRVRVRYQPFVDYVDSVLGERFIRHQPHQESHVNPPADNSCSTMVQKDKDNVD